METKEGKKRGLWMPEEDMILKNYVETYGEGNWADISRKSGLKRGGKSCRLRWKNYLRPNIKRGGMSEEEEDLIIRMHKLLGNRWSLIAGRLPGRTDNEVKNYWNTHLNKKCQGSKRKATDSNSGINNITISNNNNAGYDKDNKRHRGSERLDFVPGWDYPTATAEMNQGLEGIKDEANEASIVTKTRTEDMMRSFSYDMESPLMLSDYATSAFDDFEPSFAFFDIFPLF